MFGACYAHLPLITLVHWSSPVRKSVFSQQRGPVRRSSPVRKLVGTVFQCKVWARRSVSNPGYVVLISMVTAKED